MGLWGVERVSIEMVFGVVIVLSVFQLATIFSFSKYVQAINKQVELNSEYVVKLLQFVENLTKKHPELENE